MVDDTAAAATGSPRHSSHKTTATTSIMAGFAPCPATVQCTAPRTPTTNTAVALLKAALSSVLGFPIGRSTAGQKYSEGDRARLTVVTNLAAAPSDADMQVRRPPRRSRRPLHLVSHRLRPQRVVELANALVAKDLPLLTFEMDRATADEAYGNAMYDKFEVPAEVRPRVAQLPPPPPPPPPPLTASSPPRRSRACGCCGWKAGS